MQEAVSRFPRGIDAQVSPEGRLELLSQDEVNRLRDASQRRMYDLLWRCAFAVLKSGDIDDSKKLLESAQGFDIRVLQRDQCLRLPGIAARARRREPAPALPHTPRG